MATTSIASSSPLVALLRKHSPSSLPSTPSASNNDYSSADISKSLFPDTHLTETEKEEQSAWLSTAAHIGSNSEDEAKTSERLAHLNTHLASRTTILGHKPSLADVALYAQLSPLVKSWSPEERTGEKGYHHIVRHLAFVQGSTKFGLAIDDADKIQIDEDDLIAPIKPIDPKAEKERKKKEKEAAVAAAGGEPNGTAGEESTSGGRKAKKEAKAAAAAAQQPPSTGETVAAAVGAATPGVVQPSDGQPKEGKKKEKAPKPKKQTESPKETPLSPSLIDLRVGHILKAERHPDADSLYVSTIACGDAPGAPNTSEYEGQVVRTVCSGLNGLIPLEEMQGRKIIAVCNLKPVKMRGIMSAAMVLAASPRVPEGETDSHAGPVELVTPPEGSAAGDRVNFEGWEGEPEGQLNPKKKVWETCQVGFTTTPECEVAFDAGAVSQLEGKSGVGKLKTSKGVCAVRSLKGATVR